MKSKSLLKLNPHLRLHISPAIPPPHDIRPGIVRKVAFLTQGPQVTEVIISPVLVQMRDRQKNPAARERVRLTVVGPALLALIAGPHLADVPGDRLPVGVIFFFMEHRAVRE